MIQKIDRVMDSGAFRETISSHSYCDGTVRVKLVTLRHTVLTSRSDDQFPRRQDSLRLIPKNSLVDLSKIYTSEV